MVNPLDPDRSTEHVEDAVRYVVVVHGIGQQKKNETVLPVIYRMAEARAAAARPFGSPITRGVIASQLREAPAGELSTGLEEGWVEFEGIPQDPAARRYAPFIGRKSERPGTNLRFVDLHWASVMDGQFNTFGEPTAVWTRALIDRLENREAPPWILETLHALREGVIPLQRLLSKRLPGLSDKIFNRFLGDVQLYGEYLATRGMAVRRFHERLAGIERRHQAETGRPARYTVIAHSLGCIMSFDALTFAHMRAPTNAAAHERLLQLLPEYDRDPSTGVVEAGGERKDLPDLGWIRNVDAFVTLGSSIDKFLILWWLNYEHLTAPHDDWLDLSRLREASDRIRHYNYCDSQDPVGHELDVAYSEGTVTDAIFQRIEDVVFSRYPTPGGAHLDYWTDGALFRRILDLAVDGPVGREPQPVSWFKPGAYLRGLFWSYVAIPLAGWLAASAALVWTFGRAESWLARSSGTVLGLGILVGTCWLLGLMIRWRAAVSHKEGSAADRLQAGEKRLRDGLRTGFCLLMGTLPVLWLYLLLGAAKTRWPDRSWPAEGLLEPVQRLTAGLPTAVETLAGFFGRAGSLPEHGWILTAVVAAFAVGFALATWRVFVLARVGLRWRQMLRGLPGQRLTLDFRRYLDTDPTRPDPLERGITR